MPFLLGKIEDILGSGLTFSDDLDKVGKKIFPKKWIGVFSADLFPLDKENLNSNYSSYMLINIDTMGNSGIHWLSAVIDSNKRIAYIYDSFGRPLCSKKNSIVDIKKLNFICQRLKLERFKILEPEYDPEQLESQSNCGQRSILQLLIFDAYGWDYAKLI